MRRRSANHIISFLKHDFLQLLTIDIRSTTILLSPYATELSTCFCGPFFSMTGADGEEKSSKSISAHRPLFALLPLVVATGGHGKRWSNGENFNSALCKVFCFFLFCGLPLRCGGKVEELEMLDLGNEITRPFFERMYGMLSQNRTYPSHP